MACYKVAISSDDERKNRAILALFFFITNGRVAKVILKSQC